MPSRQIVKKNTGMYLQLAIDERVFSRVVAKSIAVIHAVGHAFVAILSRRRGVSEV